MGLTTGTKLGPYEILSPLGAGGMGEVYRARDSRLKREVAIKVLPQAFSLDTDRLRRFEQEALATAALNHPNILAIFDIGTNQGSPYVVSELLEGETLRERLRNGPIPVRKVLDDALQIARGLAAAHEKGIVHRDLKPENLFITKDERVKILDFGLAKLTQSDSGANTSLPTATRGTEAGVVLGTAGYMSPEQVRGLALDARSDIFSFGAILYEMLSGKRAFHGDTSADTMSSILKEDPSDFTVTGRVVPPLLERIVRHCLEKDPAARFQSARDVGFDLESLSSISSPLPALRTEKAPKKWLVPGLVVAAAGLLVAGLLIGRQSVPESVPAQYHQLTFAREAVNSARFAPDQRTVIYSSAIAGGASELFSVTPESLAPTSLGQKDTEVAAISPSGELLVIQQRRQLFAYASVGVLARAPLTGAGPRPILSDVQDADWGPDNQIAVARFAGGRYRLEYPIGHVLYETSGYVSDVHLSPKGDLIAFADHPMFGDNGGTVAVVDSSSGRKRNLSTRHAGILGLAWHPSGKEVWFSGTDVGISAQLKSVDLSGHTRVVAGVPGTLNLHDIAHGGRVLLSHQITRTIAMARGPGQNQERDLTITDWTLVDTISPDGRQVLLQEEGTGSRPGYDIYVRSTDGSPPVRIGQGNGNDFSPDMKWVLATLRGQLFLVPLGPGEPQPITQDSIDHVNARFLPDGKGVVFTGVEPGHRPRIYTQTIGAGSPRAITPEDVRGAIPTADGKFVFGFSDVVALYPVDGQGAPRKLSGIHPDDAIASILSDGRSVLVVSVINNISLEIFRVDLSSGRRELFSRIGPPDPAGVSAFPSGSFTPDGKYYAYAYNRTLSHLYAADGLR